LHGHLGVGISICGGLLLAVVNLALFSWVTRISFLLSCSLQVGVELFF
jgi:prolipoprotein diacylglyceryltransferase